MPRLGLTPVQSKLYRFIRDNSPFGVCPTYDEMAAGIGLSSKSTIGHLLGELTARGWISWSPKANRSARAIPPDPYAAPNLERLDDTALYQLGVRIAKIQLARRDAA